MKHKMKHELKLNTDYYEESEHGLKTFELRKKDRDYKVGDILELREWIQGCDKGTYSGRVH